MSTKIKIRHRGPMAVKGDFKLFDADGKEITLQMPSPVLLCRCGASKNKPFCDASHYKTSFEAL